MHNIALYTTTNNLKNKIFSRECRDNVSEKWILLREKLLKVGINFNTFDTYDDLDCISASVYLNVNNEYLSNDSSRLKILIIGEPPIIHNLITILISFKTLLTENYLLQLFLIKKYLILANYIQKGYALLSFLPIRISPLISMGLDGRRDHLPE